MGFSMRRTRWAVELMESERIAWEHTVQDYKADIIEYMWKLEFQNKPDPAMIECQPELDWNVRPYLIDFLIELHAYFRLQPETLFLACSIADRYLSKRMVYKKHYQLVVTTALWIAAKYDGKKSRTPRVKELVVLCRNVYDSKMFAQMELHILSTLNWEVGSMTSVYNSLSLYLEMDHLRQDNEGNTNNNTLAALSEFLAELSMYERNYMYFSSAVQALSAVLVASKLLSNTKMSDFIYSSLLEGYGYSTHGQFDANSPNTNSAAQRNLPLLQLDDATLEDIRQCCLLYVNDMYKIRTSNKKLPTVLIQKYRRYSIEVLLEQFTSRNMNSYINLCQLTQATSRSVEESLLNKSIQSLADVCIGLSIPPKLSEFNNDLSLDTLTPLTTCNNINDEDSDAYRFLNNSQSPKTPAHAMDTDCPSPTTPGPSAGSLFSYSQSLLSQSTASSPMLVHARKPIPSRANSISSVHSYRQGQRVLTRLNSIESTMIE